MRRTFGYIAFVIGLVLIFLSPLLRWYSFPRVAKAQNDVYSFTRTDGVGKYFSSASLSLVGPTNLTNISIAKGEPKASTHDVVVISIFTRTFNTATGADVDYTQDIYVMDRVTGYAVHCCGERPRHEGLTLKFPFGVQKRTYLFYDSSAQKAFPATFVKEQKVHGLNTYMFVQDVPQTLLRSMTFPGFLAGQPDQANVTTLRYYTAHTSLWVEPFTGAVIRANQRNKQWLCKLTSPNCAFTDTSGGKVATLAEVRFRESPRGIESTARRIRAQFGQLKMVRDTLPIAGPIIGVILAVVGLILIFRGEKRQAKPAVQPATEAAV